MEPPRGFAFFEHTADVGIRAWGATLDEAFGEAALGLVAQIIDVSSARSVGEVEVTVEAATRERLLYQFLDELLFLVQTKLWVITEADVTLEPGKLRARLRGESYDAERHGHLHEVKAITFHELEVRTAPPEVRVVVDI